MTHAATAQRMTTRRKLFALALMIVIAAEVDVNGACGCDAGPMRSALVSVQTPTAERTTGV